ncbi:MAG: hypothetical protein PHX62_00910 [Bacilli bacterium]|nr:hypothetical protein [Bacilli bacterium]
MKKILVIIGLFFLVFASGCVENAESGKVSIEIRDLEDVVLFSEEIVFTEEDSLVGILETNENINMKSKQFVYGLQVLELCGVNSDSAYWALYVDGEYSLVGVSDIVLKDQIEIEFVLTPLE